MGTAAPEPERDRSCEWSVHLSGDELVMKALAKRFKKDSPHRILRREGGEYCLASKSFESLDDAWSVSCEADKIVERLNRLLEFLEGEQKCINTGAVYCYVNPSRTDTIICVETAKISFTTCPLRVLINGELSMRDDFPAVAGIMESNPHLDAALRYYQDEPGWLGYYKAYEAIKKANGGVEGLRKKGWATKQQQIRFRCSANDERHHESLDTDNPMSLEEAKSFLLSLINKWIEEKLSLKK